MFLLSDTKYIPVRCRVPPYFFEKKKIIKEGGIVCDFLS